MFPLGRRRSLMCQTSMSALNADLLDEKVSSYLSGSCSGTDSVRDAPCLSTRLRDTGI